MRFKKGDVIRHFLETEIPGQMNITDFPEVLPDRGGEK